MASLENFSRTVTAFSSWSLTTAARVAPMPLWDGQRTRTSSLPLIEATDSSAPQAAQGAVRQIVRRMLGEELVRSVLIRERKRADRFDKTFALGTIGVRARSASNRREPLDCVVEALFETTRDVDTVGWFRQDAVVGVILPDLDRIAGEQVIDRVNRDFARRVDPDTLLNLEINWYVHDGPGPGDHGLSETDPLLEHLRALQRTRSVLDGFKRALDVVGSLAILALLAPILLAIAIVVKLTSPGPVLFRQVRVGQLARPFTMLKFRTMHAKADHSVHQQFVTDFITANGQQAGPDGKLFKIVNDARVTPVGRFLRKTSLDELPQLWNVLRGEMSLVGPRPPLHYELDQYRPWHWRRVLEAKPGVTGLWQVTGRSRTTFDEMVRLDLRYIKTRSLWADVKILLATPRAVVTGKGAC